MASDKIFVDLDEEIIFTVERIVASPANRVIVVIPESANLVASFLSLKLLSRQILKTNKNIVVVTEDKLGLKLSTKAGLIAKEKISEITPKVWIEAEELKKKYLEEKNQLKNSLLSERNETSDYKIVDLGEEKSEESTAENKQKGENISGDEGFQESKTQENKEPEMLSVIPEKPRLDPKVVNLGVIKVLAGGDIEQNSKFLEDIAVKPKVIDTPVVGKIEKDVETVSELSKKYQKKEEKQTKDGEKQEDDKEAVQNEKVEDEEENGKFTEKVADAKVDKVIKEQGIFQGSKSSIIGRDFSHFAGSSVPSKRKRGKSTFSGDMKNLDPWKVKASAGNVGNGKIGSAIGNVFGKIKAFYNSGDKRIKYAVSALVLFIVAYLLTTQVFASASVTIRLSKANVNVSENVTGSLNLVQADYAMKTLPIRQIKVEDSASNSADTTGNAKDGNKAKGLVTIYNKTENVVNLASGSIIQNISTSLQYKTLSATTIPAAVIDGSNNVNVGVKEDIQVEAVAYGESSNVTGSASYKVANYTTDQLTAKSFSDITGGTTSEDKAVAKTDLDTLQAQIVEGLKETLKDELDQLVSDDELILVDTIKYGTPTATSDKKVDEKADAVTVTVKLSATAFVVSKKDLKSFVAQSIQGSSQFEGQVDQNKLADPVIENVKVGSDNKVTFTISASGNIIGGASEDEIKTSIAGKSIGEANAYLDKMQGVDSYKLSVGPFYLPGFLKKIPKDHDKITVVIRTVS